jgi:hypothetical protein
MRRSSVQLPQFPFRPRNLIGLALQFFQQCYLLLQLIQPSPFGCEFIAPPTLPPCLTVILDLVRESLDLKLNSRQLAFFIEPCHLRDGFLESALPSPLSFVAEAIARAAHLFFGFASGGVGQSLSSLSALTNLSCNALDLVLILSFP